MAFLLGDDLNEVWLTRRTLLKAAGAAGLFSLAGSLLAACGDDDDDADEGEGEGEATTVRVVLTEWDLEPSAASVPAGEVTFEVANAGTMDHNFVLIKTDLAADQLNLTGDGTQVDEEGTGDVIVSTDPFGPGETDPETHELVAGHYVMLCNVAGHYQLGMRADFEAT